MAKITKAELVDMAMKDFLEDEQNYRQFILDAVENEFNRMTEKQLSDLVHYLPDQECKDCKEIFEDEEELVKCPKCGGKRIEQI